VNEEEKKLVFSEKDASWLTYSPQIKIGDVYDGIVSSLFHYGAFVHLRFPDGTYWQCLCCFLFGSNCSMYSFLTTDVLYRILPSYWSGTYL
jgi:hypothetical protein